MPNIVHINGTFNTRLKQEVKQSLRNVSRNDEEIFFRINSLGGNLHILNLICGFIYFMSKYKNFKIVAQAKHAESAALILFLNCPVRQVAPGSVGIIHLPVPNTKMEQIAIDKKRKEVIEFIKRRTNMTEELILSLQDLPLGPAEMLKLGIATEKVKIFN